MLHSAALLGHLTDGWIDVQVRSQRTFGFRLLGLLIAADAERQPHWLLASDRWDRWLAYKGIYKSEGLSLRWLARAFAENPPSLIHAHYGTAAALHDHLARSLRVPLASSFYGSEATARWVVESRIWKRRFRRSFAAASAFFAEGPAMAARLTGLGCPEEKIHVVRLPANAELLARCQLVKTNSFEVVAPGWFKEKKGHDTALKAFASALRGRDARIIMLGGGDREPELRRIAAEQGISRQVEWPGPLDFVSFMNRIGSAAVAVYPSREARDGDSDGGAPVSLIESQWLGVPSVISHHDDLPFVASPKGSIVLPPLAVEQWADALRSLYDDPTQLSRMGDAARTFVRDRHSPAANASKREEIYASL